MKLSFHGADRGVTGSCHLIEVADARILVDCGMFQGGRRLDEENSDPFGFDPANVDFLILTHAHLDHCGRLPLLYRRGFRGEVIATAATKELSRVVLLDSAHIQEEDARHHRKHGQEDASPLYGHLDVLNTFEQYGRSVGYGERLTIGPGIGVEVVDAGHILGSASVSIQAPKTDGGVRVAFSGDIGNGGRPLLNDPVSPGAADVAVMETTYGDSVHKGIGDSVSELIGVIARTHARGGNVVIPTFALERAQEILFFLNRAIADGELPETLGVYLDSPMAISATEIFEHHPEGFKSELLPLFEGGRDPFSFPGLRFTRETAESKALNEIEGAVIMAGSGMATAGRVLHHLQHNVSKPNASVVLVGYAANGTLARALVDGRNEVKIYGEKVPVRAEVHTINGFSAHADRDELLAWHRAVDPERTFLVHGDEDVMESFATLLDGGEVDMPSLGEEVAL